MPPCVRASVRPSFRSCLLLARYLTNHWTEFHLILTDDVVEATDELSRFWRSRGQGQCHSKVSEIFEWVTAAGEGIHIDALASKYHLVLCCYLRFLMQKKLIDWLLHASPYYPETSTAYDVSKDEGVRLHLPVPEVAPDRLHARAVDVLVVDAGPQRRPQSDGQVSFVVNHQWFALAR